MYTRFQSSYYNRESQPFLTPKEFKFKTPIIVVDLSYQNESVKIGPIEVRISIELKTPSHENTQAYCLLIQDRLVDHHEANSVEYVVFDWPNMVYYVPTPQRDHGTVASLDTRR